jgi:mRNA interferase RelE/StbE
MAYRVKVSKQAKKQLDKIPAKQRQLIISWIVRNLDGCESPHLVTGGKPLQGTENGWRYRVGSYRILVQVREAELILAVVRVGPRQGIYSNMPKM